MKITRQVLVFIICCTSLNAASLYENMIIPKQSMHIPRMKRLTIEEAPVAAESESESDPENKIKTVKQILPSSQKQRSVTDVEFLVWCESDNKCTKVTSFDIVDYTGPYKCEQEYLFISFGAYENNFSTFNDNKYGYVAPGSSMQIKSAPKRSDKCLKIKRFIFLFLN
jgi:hypothetical protein